jgi:hypothetical protein
VLGGRECTSRGELHLLGIVFTHFRIKNVFLYFYTKKNVCLYEGGSGEVGQTRRIRASVEDESMRPHPSFVGVGGRGEEVMMMMLYICWNHSRSDPLRH